MVAVETPDEPLAATRALRKDRAAPALAPPPDPAAAEPDLPTVCQADIARDDLTGLRLEQYVLGQRIGHGGMGKVFRARHSHLDRILAIKFVAADLSGLPEAQQRFEQETRALGQLQHPQIVNAVDAGSCNGLMYLVTEYIEGEDLAELVERRGPLPHEEGCDLIRQATRGLAYLHARGFVHRDIKPSNLIVDRAGCVKILDFGLVRSVHTDHQLTDDGQALGTWDFLAPEQAHDASDVDARCDIYSLGCTLLYLLSGGVPFGGPRYASPAAKLKGHLFDTPAGLDQPPAGVTPELIAVLHRMLAKSPSDRFASADDVLTALAPFTTPVHAPAAAAAEHARSVHEHALSRWMRLCALLVIIGIIAVDGLLHSRPEGPDSAPALTPPSASVDPVLVPTDTPAPAPSRAADPATNSAAPMTAAPDLPQFESHQLDRATVTTHRTSNAFPDRVSLPGTAHPSPQPSPTE